MMFKPDLISLRHANDLPRQRHPEDPISLYFMIFVGLWGEIDGRLRMRDLVFIDLRNISVFPLLPRKEKQEEEEKREKKRNEEREREKREERKRSRDEC
jgi:hypothetical protein